MQCRATDKCRMVVRAAPLPIYCEVPKILGEFKCRHGLHGVTQKILKLNTVLRFSG
jgi:hypothetical protein